MSKILILLLVLITLVFSQIQRENFLGGYDVTVDIYEGGAVVSYWKAIKFTCLASGSGDTLKWGYISHAPGTIDSINMAVWSSDEVNNRPKNLLFQAFVLDWNVPGSGVVDIPILVSTVDSSKNLVAGKPYFISMYTSSTGTNLLARGNAASCVPNPRKIGYGGGSRVYPAYGGGSGWNTVYNPNCYGWGVYTAGAATPPSDPSPTSTSTDSIYHGVSITVSGSSFGTKVPAAPIAFVDFENMAANNHSAILDHPAINQASPSDDTKPHAMMQVRETSWTIDGQVMYPPHSNSTKFPGGIHFEGPSAQPYIGGGYGYRDALINFLLQNRCDTVYVAWDSRMHPAWPIDSCIALGVNHKYVVGQIGTTAYADTNWYWSWRGNDAPDYGEALVTMSGGQYNPCGLISRTRPNQVASPLQGWTKHEIFYNDSGVVEKVNNVTGHITVWNCDIIDLFSIAIGGYWRMVLLGTPPNLRGSSRAGIAFDDAYVDSTYSRVVLGNASTYAACTMVEPQPAVTWSNTAITVTPNLGMLSDDANVYLYVFNKLNSSNTDGLLIPVAGAAAPVQPGGINITIHKLDTLTVTP